MAVGGAALGAGAAGVFAIGAVALGAVAIGAMAIGRLALGRVAIERAELKSVRIGDLTVARLHAGAINGGQSVSDSGILHIASPFGVDDTVARITRTLEARGVRLFAEIDHSAEAAKAGLSMRPTRLLIAGNPAAGTPLMLAAPLAAIDLPLKILVSEDESGRTWIAYNSPAYLKARHGVPDALLSSIDVVPQLMTAALNS
jgi:uncharacterized protein (DUF302 family)